MGVGVGTGVEAGVGTGVRGGVPPQIRRTDSGRYVKKIRGGKKKAVRFLDESASGEKVEVVLLKRQLEEQSDLITYLRKQIVVLRYKLAVTETRLQEYETDSEYEYEDCSSGGGDGGDGGDSSGRDGNDGSDRDDDDNGESSSGTVEGNIGPGSIDYD